jgi:cell division protein FtsW
LPGSKENPGEVFVKIPGITSDTIQYDIKLLFPVLMLVGIGIVMVYSASSAMAMNKFGADSYFLKKQSLFALSGIVALVVFRHISYKLFRPLTYLILLFALVLLISVKIPGIGYSAGGAERWIRFSGISFQPSEFARFAMIIYLAYSMSKKQEKIEVLSIGFIPHVAVLILFTGLIMIQPDFGSVMILCAVTWIMLFAGGVRITHLLSGLIVIIPPAIYLLQTADYRIKRILSFLDPWKHSSDSGYQVVHSLMAFGSGGIFGSGIGQGYQKLFYLPEPHTDFIFAVIGEELGLLGVLVIVGLYSVIMWRGISIAKKSKDLFGSFVAIGLTSALGLQVFINIGVAMGLLPPKGLALPFLSYGGTSLLVNMACIGILMNIGASQTR